MFNYYEVPNTRADRKKKQADTFWKKNINKQVGIFFKYLINEQGGNDRKNGQK